jgi:hypothetical protein
MLVESSAFHKVEISHHSSDSDRKTIIVSAKYIFQKTHDANQYY